MRLIDRYLLRQLLGPTLLATLALTSVALLSQSLSALDVIINQRQSAGVFLKITLLAMPQLINMVMPIALFVAALVALNRLQSEQEIVVCFAGGMSRWRVVSPPLRLRRDYSHPLVSFQGRGEAVAGPGITPATASPRTWKDTRG